MKEEFCNYSSNSSFLDSMKFRKGVGDMKKKCIIICSIVVLAIGCIWMFCLPKSLGNMQASFTDKKTSISEISFALQKGETIKFSFHSDIKTGDLELILYDSKDHEVYVLDHASALETFYTTHRDDTYTLKAIYKDFAGSFKITVYETNKSR